MAQVHFSLCDSAIFKVVSTLGGKLQNPLPEGFFPTPCLAGPISGQQATAALAIQLPLSSAPAHPCHPLPAETTGNQLRLKAGSLATFQGPDILTEKKLRAPADDIQYGLHMILVNSLEKNLGETTLC